MPAAPPHPASPYTLRTLPPCHPGPSPPTPPPHHHSACPDQQTAKRPRDRTHSLETTTPPRAPRLRAAWRVGRGGRSRARPGDRRGEGQPRPGGGKRRPGDRAESAHGNARVGRGWGAGHKTAAAAGSLCTGKDPSGGGGNRQARLPALFFDSGGTEAKRQRHDRRPAAASRCRAVQQGLSFIAYFFDCGGGNGSCSKDWAGHCGSGVRCGHPFYLSSLSSSATPQLRWSFPGGRGRDGLARGTRTGLTRCEAPRDSPRAAPAYRTVPAPPVVVSSRLASGLASSYPLPAVFFAQRSLLCRSCPPRWVVSAALCAPPRFPE